MYNWCFSADVIEFLACIRSFFLGILSSSLFHFLLLQFPGCSTSSIINGRGGGAHAPPAFHTLAKGISLNGGATHFTLRLKPCISSSFLIINIPTTPSLNYPVAPLINGPICRNMAGNTSLIILNSTSQLLSSVFLSAFSKTATSTGFSILAFFYILKRCKST